MTAVDINKVDQKVRAIWEGMHLEKSWKSLSLSEQLYTISNLKSSICELYEMGKDSEVESLSPELILGKITGRGFNRTRQLDLYFQEIKNRKMEMTLDNPVDKEKLLNHYRKLMNAIDLQYSDDDDKLKEN